jgi:hypothetical protein
MCECSCVSACVNCEKCYEFELFPVSNREREVCVCVCVCMRDYLSERRYACVCVCVREREIASEYIIGLWWWFCVFVREFCFLL